MAKDRFRKLLDEALKAGQAREYERAVGLLASLLAESDAGGAIRAEALLLLGRSYHAMGDIGQSIECFRRYLRAGGEPGAGFFFLGRAYLSQGLAQEAAHSFARSLETAPNRPSTWALLGAAELKLKRSGLAVKSLERAIELAPQDRRIYQGYLRALFIRAVRLLGKGDAETAAQALAFVLANGLDSPAIRLWRARALRLLGRPEAALEDCAAARAQAPDDPSIPWLEVGLLLAAGRSEEALERFEIIRRNTPNLPAFPGEAAALGRLRAAHAFREGRWKEAVDETLFLLHQSPRDARLHALAAESLRALGRIEQARDHWERAQEADPRSPEIRLGLALALWELGDYRGALAAVERALRLGADPAESEYYAVLCESRLGGAPAELIPRLQALIHSRARSGEGADPRLMFALGDALYRSERPDLARGWFEKVLFLVPEHEQSLLYRISVAESLGDREALWPAYADYLTAYPDNSAIRREYVERLSQSGRWEELATAIEGGLAYGEPGPGIRRLLARGYRECGRWQDAALIYRELLLANPEDGELLLALALCLEKLKHGAYALTLLEKAPAAAKRGAAIWIVMGILAERRGKKEAAIDAFRKACEIEPRHPRPWRELARVYEDSGLAEFAEKARAEAATLERRLKKTTASAGSPLPGQSDVRKR